MPKFKAIANIKGYKAQLQTYSLKQLEAEVETHKVRLQTLATRAALYSQRAEKLDTKDMYLEKKEELGLADIKHKTTVSLEGLGGKVKHKEKGHITLGKDIEKNKSNFEKNVNGSSTRNESLRKSALINALVESGSEYNNQLDRLNKFNNHMAEFDTPNDVKSKLVTDLQSIETLSNQVGALLKNPNTPKKEIEGLVAIQKKLFSLKTDVTQKNDNLKSKVNAEERLHRLPANQGVTEHMKAVAKKETAAAVSAGNKRHDSCNDKLIDFEKKVQKITKKVPVSSVVTKAQEEVKKEPVQQALLKSAEETTPLKPVSMQFKDTFNKLTTSPEVTELLEKIKPQLNAIERYKDELLEGDIDAQLKGNILNNFVIELRQSKTMEKVASVLEELYTPGSNRNTPSNYDTLNKPRGIVYEKLGWKPTSAGLVDALITAINDNKPTQEQDRKHRI